MLNGLWSWLVSLFTNAPVVINELKPVVTEGEALVVDLTKVVSDLKTNNLFSVVADAQAVLADAKQFVADVEVIVQQLQAAKK